jgi:hypothetical protein
VGMATIKVAVRCRPFSETDELGVHMVQREEGEGEVNLLKSQYPHNRFAFSYAWWSAFGYERFIQGNPPEAAAMTLMTQEDVYSVVGKRICGEFLDGEPVVLFAYGLSGSGKTYTVFGPDAVNAPEAWFNSPSNEPAQSWGIFPRVAYEVFQQKEVQARRGGAPWTVSLRYFQNIVNDVRDLASPLGQEKNFKTGLHRDESGFMEFDWVSTVPLSTFSELCSTVKEANRRKALAATQFNWCSTRGHCILQLELTKPNESMPDVQTRCRLYVCDLAGTEPAADIVASVYERRKIPDPTRKGELLTEYELVGEDPNPAKTKELVNQGKKINLSLTEISQFFMKMAQGIKAKKLKPGDTIPGCNTYFLGKFLKDTMLSAKTYLFCAVRPEKRFQRYTYATLAFAKNANVVKLKPRRLVAGQAPAVGLAMKEEIGALKAQVEVLQSENKRLSDLVRPLTEMVNRLQSQAAQAAALASSEKAAAVVAAVAMAGEELSEIQDRISEVVPMTASEPTARDEHGRNSGSAQEHRTSVQKRSSITEKYAEHVSHQVREYSKRGIVLAAFAGSSSTDQEAHFINLDADPFHSERFMYPLTRNVTTLGPGGDIQPEGDKTIVSEHCRVERTSDFTADGEDDALNPDSNNVAVAYMLTKVKGVVFRNGKALGSGEAVKLLCYDRIVLGAGNFLLFVNPADASDYARPSADDAISEFTIAQSKGEKRRKTYFSPSGGLLDLSPSSISLMEDYEDIGSDAGGLEEEDDEDEDDDDDSKGGGVEEERNEQNLELKGTGTGSTEGTDEEGEDDEEEEDGPTQAEELTALEMGNKEEAARLAAGVADGSVTLQDAMMRQSQLQQELAQKHAEITSAWEGKAAKKQAKFEEKTAKAAAKAAAKAQKTETKAAAKAEVEGSKRNAADVEAADLQRGIAETEREAVQEEMKAELTQLSRRLKGQLRLMGFKNITVQVVDVSESQEEDSLKVKIHHGSDDVTVFLDGDDVSNIISILNSEVGTLTQSFEDGLPYTVLRHRHPIDLIFDSSAPSLVGSANIGPFLVEMFNELKTDHADKWINIKSSVPPYEVCGRIMVGFVASFEYGEPDVSPGMALDELVGKSMNLSIHIKSIERLPFKAHMCYVSFEFLYESFTSDLDAMGDQAAKSLELNFETDHYIPVVAQDFIDDLQSTGVTLEVYATPQVYDDERDDVSTAKKTIAATLGFEEAIPTGKHVSKELAKMERISSRKSWAITADGTFGNHKEEKGAELESKAGLSGIFSSIIGDKGGPSGSPVVKKFEPVLLVSIMAAKELPVIPEHGSSTHAKVRLVHHGNEAFETNIVRANQNPLFNAHAVITHYKADEINADSVLTLRVLSSKKGKEIVIGKIDIDIGNSEVPSRPPTWYEIQEEEARKSFFTSPKQTSVKLADVFTLGELLVGLVVFEPWKLQETIDAVAGLETQLHSTMKELKRHDLKDAKRNLSSGFASPSLASVRGRRSSDTGSTDLGLS